MPEIHPKQMQDWEVLLNNVTLNTAKNTPVFKIGLPDTNVGSPCLGFFIDCLIDDGTTEDVIVEVFPVRDGEVTKIATSPADSRIILSEASDPARDQWFVPWEVVGDAARITVTVDGATTDMEVTLAIKRVRMLEVH